MLWARDYTDRHLFGAFDIPVTWFQSLNPFMIFAFTPFIVALWRWQDAREPSTVAKLSIGRFLDAASWLIMFAAAHAAGTGRTSWLWLFGFFVLLTIGELYLSPTGLSWVTKVAPVPSLVDDDGRVAGHQFHRRFSRRLPRHLWSSMAKADFFLLLAVISASAGLFIAIISRPLARVLMR